MGTVFQAKLMVGVFIKGIWLSSSFNSTWIPYWTLFSKNE